MKDSEETLDELRLRLTPFAASLAELTYDCVARMVALLAAETLEQRVDQVAQLTKLRYRTMTIFRNVLPGNEKVEEFSRVSREYEEDTLLPFARGELSKADFYVKDVAYSKIAHRVTDDVMSCLGIPEDAESGLPAVLGWVDQLHGMPPGTAGSV